MEQYPITPRTGDDGILGMSAERQMIRRISREFLVPSAQKTKTAPGKVMDINIHYVVPQFHYIRRADILGILNRNIFIFYALLPTTNYMRKPGGWFTHLRKAMNYRRLYASIVERGLLYDADNVFSTPWLFASSECIYRLDGHHRASIARHLGYETIKARVMTPADIIALDELPASYREFLVAFHQPVADLTVPPEQSLLAYSRSST